MHSLSRAATLAFGLILATPLASADDWPQWMGPNRDGIWAEDGIMQKFPEGGLNVRWKAPVGLGYSGPAVADGRVYLMDYIKSSGKIANNAGARDRLEGKERVLCLDAETGKPVWEHAYDRPYAVSYGSGPRCTPTVDGDKVYTLGAEGNLFCLSAANGEVIWSKDFVKDYKAETPMWGFSGHPLVDGDTLYCLVGGEGSVAVAFDKHTGTERWRALTARETGYCPPTMIEHAGVKQLLIWHAEALNSLNPKTGEVYWSIELKPDYAMSIAAPRLSGDLLYAGGIRSKGAAIRLSKDKPAAEVEWRGTTRRGVYPATATPLIDDGIIYGADAPTGMLIAARLEDGERLWQTTDPTTGGRRKGNATVFLVKNGDRFVLFSETGDLILANLSAEGYEEISRANILEPTNTTSGREVIWSHPAFAERCVFARSDKEIVCVDLSAKN